MQAKAEVEFRCRHHECAAFGELTTAGSQPDDDRCVCPECGSMLVMHVWVTNPLVRHVRRVEELVNEVRRSAAAERRSKAG